ncbi:CvpA family protein [Candidatus Gottesmanbacteria bacterium]|nr:CvpA family protein [Candidatus Gottesmanbacteria bacterium]
MKFNWVDWVIVAVSAYYFATGWESGLALLFVNLFAFVGSLWFSVRFHSPVGIFLTDKFGIPAIWSTVLGYIIVAMFAEIVLSEIGEQLVSHLPKKFLVSKANQWLGAAVSLVNGLVIVTFILLIILALPLRGTVKADIRDSQIAKALVRYAQRFGGVQSAIDQAASMAEKFLTISPTSHESVNLNINPTQSDLTVDEAAEAKMLTLVNSERAKAGVGPPVVDSKLTAVARAHSMDMFVRHYFSHVTPDGQDLGARLAAGGVSYAYAGENIAYAPDVDAAHQGLMNSPEHKKNILDPGFHRVGIGIVNGGLYGEMFTQDFAN